MKPKMGRPKLPKGEAMGEVFSVRVSNEDAKKIHAKINHSGLNKPAWLRNTLISAAS